MTWKLPGSVLMTALALLALDVVDIGEAYAQFGFFGQPRYQRPYRPRGRARRAPPPTPSPKVVGDIPLPPPRPHFPGDPPAEPPQVGASNEPMVPPSSDPKTPAEVPKAPPPAETGPAAAPSAAPPLPPEKPAELAKPEMPARPAPSGADATPAPKSPPESKPPGNKPPMAAGPMPEELPPKHPGDKPPIAAPGPAGPASPAPTPPESTPPLPPPKPAELKPAPSGVAPSGARLGEVPRQPKDDTTCEDRLKARNVSLEPATIGPQRDERCTVVRPVHLLALTLPGGGKVEFPEHPTIACTTADAFSLYVRDLLAPLAKGTFGSPVSAVWTGPGLECRSRDHIVGAKLSAHGQGLAIDIAQLKLADGRKIEVGLAKDEAGQAFETAARTAACGYFHTVLGPGSDAFHSTHWHFDLIVRGAQGDSKYCK